MKYVVVIGGTMSGIGKGTLLSSIGVVLRSNNIACSAIKIDPYLNQDAGTMSPDEHGEVYVLDDGTEADLDLGNYERFLNLKLNYYHSLTSGKVYKRVFDKERQGVYLGKTVQVVPHIVDEVLDWIESMSVKMVDKNGWRIPEICLLEVGGTVGDIESEVYMETIRQLKLKIGPDNICICHLSYVPIVGHGQEQKSKPTQHSVKALLQRGIQPDMIFCRCNNELTQEIKEKIALFTQVKVKNVISVHNTSDIYSVPLMLNRQNVAQSILELLEYKPNNVDPLPVEYSLSNWARFCDRDYRENVKIGIVAKYNGSSDAYLSVLNALRHATLEAQFNLDVVWIDATNITTDNVGDILSGLDGVLVPGGFGTRGYDGKRLVSRHCRLNNVPFFGICLALQLSALDIAMGLEPNACHGELNEDLPVELQAITSMPEYLGENNKGGTMRLGARITKLKVGTLAHKLYDHAEEISERHRHRYEINPAFVERLVAAGVVFSGVDYSGKRMCILELPSHPFFFCTQYHPEYNSTPIIPSPPFLGFVLASKNLLEERLSKNFGKLCSGARYTSN